MWLYFNSKGQLIETLVHGNRARSGTTDFEIFAYFEGVDVANYSEASLKLRKPDLQQNEYPSLLMTKTTKTFNLQENESANHFADGNTYPGFYFNFNTFNIDEDVAILLDTPGLWKAIITLISGTGALNVQGIASFLVENGVYSQEQTEIDLDVIINQIYIELANHLLKQDGIIRVSDEDTLDLDDYEIGQVFYVLNDDDNVIKILSEANDTRALETVYDFNEVVTQEDIDTAVDAEEMRAMTAEGALDDKIDAEIARATNAENTLDDKIDNEITRAEGAEESLDNRLTAAEDSISDLDDAISAETERATGAEEALSEDISDEATTRASEDTRILNEAKGYSDTNFVKKNQIKDSRVETSGNVYDTGYINNLEDKLKIQLDFIGQMISTATTEAQLKTELDAFVLSSTGRQKRKGDIVSVYGGSYNNQQWLYNSTTWIKWADIEYPSGSIDTNNSSSLPVPANPEDVHSNIDLHKVSKTGKASDLVDYTNLALKTDLEGKQDKLELIVINSSDTTIASSVGDKLFSNGNLLIKRGNSIFSFSHVSSDNQRVYLSYYQSGITYGLINGKERLTITAPDTTGGNYTVAYAVIKDMEYPEYTFTNYDGEEVTGRKLVGISSIYQIPVITEAAIRDKYGRVIDTTYASLSGNNTFSGENTFTNGIQIGTAEIAPRGTAGLEFKTNNGVSRFVMSDTSFYPSLTEYYNLGSTTNKFKDGYFSGKINFAEGVELHYVANDSFVFTTGVYINGQLRTGHHRPAADNAYDLGAATARWKNLYLSGVLYLGNPVNSYKFVAKYDNAGNTVNISLNNVPVCDIYSNRTLYTNNIYPYANNTYSLGSTTNKWKDLYLSGVLSDGTNSVSVAQLMPKPTTDTHSGTTFSGSLASYDTHLFTDALSSLTITDLSVASGDEEPMWLIDFKTGATFTFTATPTIVWNGGTPTFSANKHYTLVIRKSGSEYLGTWLEF